VIRRINFYGGPGSGKSKSTAKVYDAITEPKVKKLFGTVMHVGEFVKPLVCRGEHIEGPKQIWTFGCQMEEERKWLEYGTDVIVTDSPLCLQAWYSRDRGEPFWQHLLGLAQYFESLYPSVNIFLDREGIPYEQYGRHQDEAGAKRVDADMAQFLRDSGIAFGYVKTVDTGEIIRGITTIFEAQHARGKSR
jgi:hypothetical protein